MDDSPLVRAHDHAHAAAVATRQSSDTTVAINEHTQAAGEFANAARNTSSVEALRTLKLLEEHHRKLAEILRLPPEPASRDAETADDTLSEKNSKSEKRQAASDDATTKKDGARDAQAVARTAQMPGVAQQRRVASREMSSSIASNLASARGIRSSRYRGQPLSPSISNDQAPGNVDPHPRRDGPKSKMQSLIDHQSGKPAWVPPVPPPARSDSYPKSPASPRAEQTTAIADDAGYARFYNSFGSLINKISAPLAFAGLPLIQEESSGLERGEETPAAAPTESPSQKRKPSSRPSTSASTEPDLSKIYSKATMRALSREGHTPNDSFYVVPTSGHTMSYASILTRAEKEKRRLEASSHGEFMGSHIDEDEDDFVDARETASASSASMSPGAKRRIGRARSEKELQNTIEELYTENKSLKDMLDKLTKRLHAFEASAQIPAMALTESYRAMRPSSPMSSSGGGGGGLVSAGGSKAGQDGSSRAHEMEEQLAAATKQMERLEKDNRKMQKTLDKYREKWEVLKAGAKARREAAGTGDGIDDAGSGRG